MKKIKGNKCIAIRMEGGDYFKQGDEGRPVSGGGI